MWKVGVVQPVPADLLNPVRGMTRREFVIADDDPAYQARGRRSSKSAAPINSQGLGGRTRMPRCE
jgi:hypothetical protein